MKSSDLVDQFMKVPSYLVAFLRQNHKQGQLGMGQAEVTPHSHNKSSEKTLI